MAYSSSPIVPATMTDGPRPILQRLQAGLQDSISARSRKQFLLLAAGSTFVVLSTTLTRRSLAHRRLATIPKFYGQNNHPAPNFNGPSEAVAALNIATLNVAAVSMMLVGGTLWAADISSMDEMRRKIRGGLGVDGGEGTEKDAEEEFEEWLASVLERKEEKERRREEMGQVQGEQRVNEQGKQR